MVIEPEIIPNIQAKQSFSYINQDINLFIANHITYCLFKMEGKGKGT